VAFTPNEGLVFNGIVAALSDNSPDTDPNHYNTTITWGDGTTSAGTLLYTSAGHFNVRGWHSYAEERPVTFQVRVTDTGGARANLATTVTTADAALTPQGLTLTQTRGQPFTAVLAKFTDADPQGTASDYPAPTIDWGDGSTTTGTVAPAPGGGFQV